MAVERVERLLRNVTAALDSSQIDYAVIGGNAVAAWVATVDEDAIRATKDVDLLVRREDLPRLANALDPLGLDPAEVLGVHMFVERVDPSPKRGVHLVLAGEKVRPEYLYPAPDPAQSDISPQGFRVIALPELLKMKLQAYRLVDQVHVKDLESVNLLTPEVIDGLPEDLRQRLREVQRKR